MKKISKEKYRSSPELRKFNEAGEETWKIIDAYENHTLIELINEYSTLWTDGKTPDDTTVKVLKAYIADTLGLTSRDELDFYDEWYIHEELIPELNELIAEVNTLKKQFLNHRHEKERNYTEKPVY